MRLLVLSVMAAAQPERCVPLKLRSLPGILADVLPTIRTHTVSTVAEALEICHAFEPDFLVFQGIPALTAQWQQCFEQLCPDVLSFCSAQSALEGILTELNPRLRQLRKGRLAMRDGEVVLSGAVRPAELFADVPVALRAQASARLSQTLLEYPDLMSLMTLYNNRDFERQLYCLALLARACADWESPSPLAVLDVGCHNWSYAPALAIFFRQGGRALTLTGLERDPWFLEARGTRAELARTHARLARADFASLDFLAFDQPQDLICHFLPLILKENALRWQALPTEHQPEALLRHSLHLLKPGGRCLLYNGTELEYQETLRLLNRVGIRPALRTPWHCPWRQGQHGFLTYFNSA